MSGVERKRFNPGEKNETPLASPSRIRAAAPAIGATAMENDAALQALDKVIADYADTLPQRSLPSVEVAPDLGKGIDV